MDDVPFAYVERADDGCFQRLHHLYGHAGHQLADGSDHLIHFDDPKRHDRGKDEAAYSPDGPAGRPRR